LSALTLARSTYNLDYFFTFILLTSFLMKSKSNQKNPRRARGKTARRAPQLFSDHIQLSLSTLVTTSGVGTATVNNSSFLWQSFYDYVVLSEIYHYMRPTSYRLIVVLDSTVMRWDGVFAFYPVNTFTGETVVGGSPADIDDVLMLKGSVLVQPQFRNVGKWTPWPKGLPQIPAYNARGDSIGNFLGYANNCLVGSLTLVLEVKFHFWERQPNFSLGKVNLPYQIQAVQAIEEPSSDGEDIPPTKPKKGVAKIETIGNIAILKSKH
jgi:hypothetical protein